MCVKEGGTLQFVKELWTTKSIEKKWHLSSKGVNMLWCEELCILHNLFNLYIKKYVYNTIYKHYIKRNVYFTQFLRKEII